MNELSIISWMMAILLAQKVSVKSPGRHLTSLSAGRPLVVSSNT